MLREDELHDLAESIKTEGQHTPIVRDADGVLLDGRNRLAACEIAGVEPLFTTYTGTDPVQLILASNLRRRHMSKGQKAMITEMARSISEHSLRDHAKLHAVSLTRLSNAATVLKHAPDLAELVRTGKLHLDAAYRTVHEIKAHAAAIQAKHNYLSQHAPDLADQVVEGLLTLDEATTALDARREEEQLRQRVRDADAICLADGDTTPPLGQRAERGSITWHQAHQSAEQFLAQRQEIINRTQQALEQLAQNWTGVQKLGAHPNTPYSQEILDGLSPHARALTARLATRV